MHQLSRLDIIAIAACPTCCAMRKEPCTFARCDDPHGKRAHVKQSHPARTLLARKKIDDIEKELAESVNIR